MWSAAACRRCRPSRRAGTCSSNSFTPSVGRGKLHPSAKKKRTISGHFPRDFGPNVAVPAPVVFDFNPWYYLHAFVALVSLLTRLTRLPDEVSVGLIFWRARQAGAQIAFRTTNRRLMN